ncbi:MAG: DUF427 domain-containing protein [Acidimicrobiales bacterium]
MRTEPCPKRIRAVLGGRVVVDTVNAVLGWEVPWYPQYFLPLADIAIDTEFANRPAPGLEGHVRVEWDAVDAWFEEDEEVFVHPRNPFTRVDALASSRHVRVEVDGVVVAESFRPTMLFETGLPRRTYFRQTDIHMDLLVPSATVTSCPYKGTTRYWSVVVPGGGETADVAWSYATPHRESAPIAGLVAFLDERVDVWVDGAAQPRPRTKFS